MNRVAREAAREARRQEVATRRRAREAAVESRRRQREYERDQRDAERAAVRSEKEAKTRYLDEREHEAESLNEDVVRRCAELADLLSHTLEIDDTISFESLRLSPDFPQFVVPNGLAQAAPRPDEQAFMAGIPAPFVLWSWLPWVKNGHSRRVAEARATFAAMLERWDQGEGARMAAIAQARSQHEAQQNEHLTQVNERNAQVDAFASAYRDADPEAIIAYNWMVLERSEYPEGVETAFHLRFVEEPRELVVEYELPSKDIVPAASEHRYVKARDTIDAKPRKSAEIRSIYRNVVASICIRTVHEIFEADQHAHVRSVVFNGSVLTIDPATGQEVRRHLVAVRAKRDAFLGLNLRKVDVLACLERMSAHVSGKPDELEGIEPISPYGSGDGVIEIDEAPPTAARRAQRR